MRVYGDYVTRRLGSTRSKWSWAALIALTIFTVMFASLVALGEWSGDWQLTALLLLVPWATVLGLEQRLRRAATPWRIATYAAIALAVVFAVVTATVAEIDSIPN